MVVVALVGLALAVVIAVFDFLALVVAFAVVVNKPVASR